MSGIIVLILRILMVALLYGFLGWAIYTLWRDLREQGQRISSPYVPTLLLVPQGDDGGELRIYREPEVVVGRSPTAECSIADETVSSRHSRLSYHHNQWWIEDMHSRNGTYLNDARVIVPTVIVSGDELRFGQVRMAIEIQEKPR